MAIAVAINNEVEQAILSDQEIEHLVQAVLQGEGCIDPCEVTVSFVSEEAIHELNREYRGIDRPTDVLSFNIDDPDEWYADEEEANEDGDLSPVNEKPLDEAELTDPADDEDARWEEDVCMLGDVILCPSIVEVQAPGFGNAVADEMRLLLVHGCLHLMGYDHEEPSEAEEMEALERSYLAGYASVPVEEVNVGPTVDHAAEGSAAQPPCC